MVGQENSRLVENFTTSLYISSHESGIVSSSVKSFRVSDGDNDTYINGTFIIIMDEYY